MGERQAGAEIGVTPEMIEAGVAALTSWYSDEIQGEAESVVREILQAALAARALGRPVTDEEHERLRPFVSCNP